MLILKKSCWIFFLDESLYTVIGAEKFTLGINTNFYAWL